jgi:thiol-disulfide isomerase/thioredoxin
MKISIVICSLILLVSCKNRKTSDEIIIRGDVKGIPDGKVYLTDAYQWMINLDSAMVKNGKFEFKIKADSSFYPYLASIMYPDSNNSFSKSSGLMIANNKFFSGFYLEKGITLITGDTVKPIKVPSGGTVIYANITAAGKQNEAFVQNKESDFGWLGNLDSVKRKTRIEYFKNQIKKFPYSYFLLASVFNARNQYSNSEWESLLSLFDKDVQQSALGYKVRKYLVMTRNSDSPYPNLMLADSENKRQYIIDSSSKINMLIFWASWCHPCRQEIPALKGICKKYLNQKLNMVSISVDENESDWKKALQREQMMWPQFIVNAEEKQLVEAKYDPSTIPLVIFTNRNGQQLARFVGYEKGQEMKYDSIVTKYLHSK